MDYPLSGLLVISWSVVSSIHFFLAIGIDALSQIRWMNHQRPFQSQSFDKTGEHNSPKLYPFVPERASISRHKNRLQDQDHSCTLILLASLKNFSILCARAFARSRKRVVVGKQRCVPLTTLQFCTGIVPWTGIQDVKITRHRGAYIAVSSF